jgi:hypothetical protein
MKRDVENYRVSSMMTGTTSRNQYNISWTSITHYRSTMTNGKMRKHGTNQPSRRIKDK